MKNINDFINDITGTIILIVDDEGEFKDDIKDFILRNKNIFDVNGYFLNYNTNFKKIIFKIKKQLTLNNYTHISLRGDVLIVAKK